MRPCCSARSISLPQYAPRSGLSAARCSPSSGGATSSSRRSLTAYFAPPWMRSRSSRASRAGAGVKLHLLDLGGDIAGNGISKLFLTIAAAFAEAERDRIRERIGQVKADQKARGRYLGGSIPFGYRLDDDGELAPNEAQQGAIREIVAMKAQGLSLRAIAAEMQAEGPPDQPRGRAGRPEVSPGRI